MAIENTSHPRSRFKASALILLVVPVLAATAQTSSSGTQISEEAATYEAFRLWLTKLPGGEQDAPDVLRRYRDSLTTQGISAAEADRRIKLITENEQRLEIERWNRILTSDKPRFNTQPNAFLVERLKGVPPGRALDVGMGQGRNAIYLAQQDWDVTGFDLADKAVEVARQEAKRLGVKLNAVVADEAEFDWGSNQWDLIVLSYVGVRENARRVVNALRPGGLVIIEGAHVDATKTQSIGGGIVFGNNELIDLFPGFRVLRYEDEMGIADFGGRVEARLVRMCAQKVQ